MSDVSASAMTLKRRLGISETTAEKTGLLPQSRSVAAIAIRLHMVATSIGRGWV